MVPLDGSPLAEETLPWAERLPTLGVPVSFSPLSMPDDRSTPARKGVSRSSFLR